MKLTTAHKSHLRKFIVVFVALFLTVLFGAALNQNPWSGSSIRAPQGTVGYEESSWVLKQGGSVLRTDLELPEYMPLETGKLYTLTTTMTYDGSKDRMPYGFIHLDHAYCRVMLDGQVLFSCMPEDIHRWDRSKSPGFIYKAFSVPEDCLGKELEIQVLPPMTIDMAYGLPELQFGDFTTTLHDVLLRDTPHDIVTILCTLIGFASIFFSTVTLRGSDYREGISIGIFSLLFSLYLVTECKLNYYFIANPYYTYLLNYTVFSLMPVALMGFMRERLLDKHRRLCNIFIGFELVFFLIEMTLHFSGILDVREVVTAIHLLYFAEMGLMVVLISRMKNKAVKHSLIFQITPVTLGMLVDAFVYWLHLGIGSNDATFTILGVLIFLFIELIHVWRSSINIYTESARSKLYRQMAYIDGLTGAGNRRAFDRELQRIQSGEQTYRSLILVSADVNNLKYVNDHFGHSAGDKLICGAVQTMMNLAGSTGKVFRTGGDEFAIFLYDTTLEQYGELLLKARQQYKAFSKANAFSLSVAVGHVELRDNKVMEAVQEADARMYADKARLKKSRDFTEQAPTTIA